MPQFDRVASVVIGIPGQTGKRFSDLRIRFTVERDLKASPNTARVEIFNLSDTSRAEIKEHLSTFGLYAGYREDGGESILFTHDVDTVEHKITPPDIVTTIETGDGRRAFRQSRIALSLAPGCKVGQVCKVVGELMHLPIKELPNSDAQFPHGFSFVGPGETALRRAAAAGGFEHSVQDGQLQFLNNGAASTRETVFLISPDTGLIGSPERIVQKDQQLSSDPAAVKRRAKRAAKSGAKIQSQFSFRCLLNPQLTPGRRVQIASRSVNGVFRLDAVRHIGDTHGDDWFSECEVSVSA